MSQEIQQELQTQAEAVFRRIERRLSHILSKLQLAAAMILNQPDQAPQPPGIAEWEYTAPHWRELVPEQPEIQAVVLHLLTQHYAVSEAAASHTLANLGWKESAVQAAYKRFYDKSPDLSSNPAQQPTPVADRFFGLEWKYLKRGETLVTQGESADRIYLLLEGLLRADVSGNDSSSSKRIAPGELIGDVSWLTDKRFDATLLALRDSDLVYMTHERLEHYVQQQPEALRKLAGGVVQRLRQPIPAKSIDIPSRSIAVLPASVGLEDFYRQLTSTLARFGSAKLLTPDVVKEALENRADLESIVDGYDFVDWLEQQEAVHKYIIYVADPNLPNWTRRCIEQADRVLIAARATQSPEITPVENMLSNIPHPDLVSPVDLVLVHDSRSPRPAGTSEWLAQRKLNNFHHVALDTTADFERLGRHLRGRAVGIAFGGGGMRGLAHGGVIKALHERGIYCDIAGGTSAGAIIAAFYGLGWESDAIVTGAVKAMDRKTMFQPTLPITAILTGNRLNTTYQEMFEGWRIEDMWVPVFTIASNLTQARMTVKSSGSLQKAVRASTSLAGILPPTIDDNYDLLLDGGAFNNTPADVVRERVGSGTVIAVDLGYTKREFPKYTYDDRINGFAVLWSRINPFMERIQVPSIMDVMMRSNGLGGMNATAAQVEQADLIIRPPVTQFGLYDKEAANEIFEAGYTFGQKIIADWIEAGGLRDTYEPL